MSSTLSLLECKIYPSHFSFGNKMKLVLTHSPILVPSTVKALDITNTNFESYETHLKECFAKVNEFIF